MPLRPAPTNRQDCRDAGQQLVEELELRVGTLELRLRRERNSYRWRDCRRAMPAAIWGRHDKLGGVFEERCISDEAIDVDGACRVDVWALTMRDAPSPIHRTMRLDHRQH